MGQINSRIKKLEKTTAPEMMEITQFRCLIDGEEKVLSALEYAYATAVEGREGKIVGRAPSIWEPVNPHPDDSALNAAFEELARERSE